MAKQIAVTPTSLAFGNRKKGTSTSKTVSLSNPGSGTTTVSNIVTFDSVYTVSPTNTTLSATGSPQVVTVTFAPVTTGQKQGIITVTSDGAPSSLTFGVDGWGVDCAAQLSASTLAFGEAVVGGTDVTRTFTVTNVGDAAFKATPTPMGTDAALFSVTPSEATVPKDGSTTFTVTFHPTAETTAVSASLTINTDELNPPTTFPSVTLTGSAVEPTISVPSTLSFADLQINTNASAILPVTNTGSGTLVISSVDVGGVAAAAYSSTTAFPLSVLSGETQNVTVKFAPTSAGQANATLTLHSNDATTPSTTVTLSGRGINPTISVPATLAFNDVQKNTSSQKTLTVNNTGLGALTGTITKGGTDQALYTFTPNTLNVPEGGSQTVTVTFSPTATGTTSATLTLATNDATTPSKTVTLSGRGINPTISVPSTLAFNDVQKNTSSQKTLTVNNTGLGALIVTVTKGGTDQALYTFTPSTLNVPEGGSQDVTVTFSPTATGTTSASLTLASNDTTTPSKTVNLSGRGVNPTISVPATLAFNDVQKNTSSQKTLTVNNTGLGALTGTITKGGTNQALYTFTPSTLNVPEGGSQDVTVTFSPTATGTASATLTLASNDTTTPSTTVTLSGRGINPTISVASPLAFGDLQSGTSLQKTLTVSNTGLGQLNVTGITKGGTGQASYTFTPNTLTIAEGGSQDVTVTFTAGALGAADATLTLASNDTTTPSKVVTLSGRSVNPAITVPSTLAFGDQQINATTTRTLTITNGGTGALEITGITKGGADPTLFDFTPATLSIPEGSSRDLTVTFAPTVQATASATLTLATNDVAKPTVTVTLTGKGVNPTITVVSSIAFGDLQKDTSTQQTLAVTNNGTGTLTVSIAKSGTGAAAYSFTPTTLSMTQGQTKNVTVTFNPTALGQADATLTLTTNDVARASVPVALSGRGVNPTISVSNSLSFGDQQINDTATRTLTVSNTGTGTLNITVTKAGTGQAAYGFTPSTLAVPEGQSRDLTVTFTPATQGTFNATLTLTTNDVATPTKTVTLSGRGINPTISVPSTLAFGDQGVGAPPASRTLTVTNTGTGTLTISGITKSGPSANDYSVSPGTLTVPEGQARDLTVTFNPAVGGQSDATITLITNDVAKGLVNVSLSGRGINPNIQVASSVAFGDLQVNTSNSQTLTVTNNGTGTLTVGTITKGGTGAAAYTFTPNSLSIPEGGNQSVTVTFNPTAVNQYDATLTLPTNDVTKPTVTVALSGAGVNPIASVPASLPFSEVQVNSTKTVPLTITNSGTGTLSITNVVKSGTGAAFYSFAQTTLSVPGGQSRDLMVTFNPLSEGSADATLTLTTTDVARSSVNVTVTGLGVNPIASVPASLAFGDVLVNSNPPPKLPLTISNTGSGTLRITNPIKSGGGAAFYTLTPSSLDIPAGQSGSFQVTFNPTVEGPADAILTLTTNDVAHGTVTVSLTGYGGLPTISLCTHSTPTQCDPISLLEFKGVRVSSTKQLAVTIKNSGRGKLIIPSTPTLTQNPSGIFSYQGPGNITVDPNSEFNIFLSFAPVATNNYSATLSINSNASATATTLNMTGFGADPSLTVSTSSIFFGDVRVGDESSPQNVAITVNNSTGPTDVTLQSLPVVGPFVVQTAATLPVIIQSGTSYTFTVKFKPTEPSTSGPVTGSVTIITDLPPRPTVALSGIGTVSKVELSVPALPFGNQRVTFKSGSQPVILSNKGAAELSITQLIFSNPAFTLEAPTLPTEANPLKIAAGTQKALSIAFTPATVGPSAGKLFIISNAFTPAPALDLSGTGVDGQMSVTPSVISFAPTDAPSTGVQQSAEVKNTGNYPLKIETVQQPTDTQFAVSGLPDGLVLQPNDTWPFTVTFKPQTRGYFAASAIIQSDAVTNKLFSLAVSGTGVAAAAELQPQDLHFGSSNVGVPITQDISVKNIGERALSVSNIAFEDAVADSGMALDFSLDSTVALPLVVDPGKSTLVKLKFTPRGPNLREAKARFFTNAGPVVATVGGTGTSPTLKLDPVELKFANVLVGNSSAPQAITITNKGSGPLTLTDIKVVGTDAASFIMTGPAANTLLQPNGTATVSVSLKADEERLFSAQLQVLSNDATAPTATVPLSGAGVGQQIQLSDTTLEFGNQLINKPSTLRTVRITNNGDTTITMSGVSVEGDGSTQFTLTKPNLPIDLKPRESQSISVVFTPQAETDVTCKLKLVFSTPVPREVTLHGHGIPSVLESKPTAVDFGAVRVNRPHPSAIEIINRSSDTVVMAKPVLTKVSGDPSFFKLDLDAVAGRAISPGASLIVALNYQPTAEELTEATLAFDTVPAQPRGLTIDLKGKATQRLLTVDPGSLDFGRVDVGQQMAPKEITVANKSAEDQWVVVKLKDVEGTHFVVDTTELDSRPIPASGSATFKIYFQPATAGEEANTVQVFLQKETDVEAEIPVAGHGRQLTGAGGGCSSSNVEVGSSGMMALLALIVLGSRRRRRE